jgi:radical SAM superfamily enzyme with C-terminal helix-hairpin-helix motif
MTIDQWRIKYKKLLKDKSDRDKIRNEFSDLSGTVVLAGSIVPGKYVRGTPVSQRELDEILSIIPSEIPILCGGWAIKNWRYSGWTPLRTNLFCAVNDVDSSLNSFLSTGEWKHSKRTKDQWELWAYHGSSSKAVKNHPDLVTIDGRPGPLTYEIELYQGCVRFKRGCKFCIEPKKGVPIWRGEDEILKEISVALDSGVRNIRFGGATDIYTYRAEGVKELEYPIPNPEPICKVLSGAREDERLDILHVDNGNPSIIAENLEPSKEITKSLVENLSDGAVLSFGLESADPNVHEMNWLNCDPNQLKIAIKHINHFGRKKGERGLPKLLPGLNFIAGLNGETKKSYDLNLKLLHDLRSEGLLLRRINIRQVEGQGFQKISENDFKSFKKKVREEIDGPLLEEIFPIGSELSKIWWESQGDRIRRPEQVEEPLYRSSSIHGKSGITFGRQIGAYPILVGVPYLIPLETSSNIIVTGHGMRSISGVEIGLDINSVSQQQLESIPGIGKKAAWRIISSRAKASRSSKIPFNSVEMAFEMAQVDLSPIAEKVLSI